LQTVIGRLTGEPKLVRLARDLGAAIETEALLTKYREVDARKHGYAQEAAKTMPSYLATVSMTRKASQVVKEWKAWTQEQQIRVGHWLVDLLKATGVVEYKLQWVTARESVYLVYPGELLSDQLGMLVRDLEFSSLKQWPMLVPPLRWSNPSDGGYISEVARQYAGGLRSKDTEQLTKVTEVGMPEVWKAVNAVQETPWRINRFVLDTITEAERREIKLPHIKTMPVIPPKPAEDATEEERKTAYQKRKLAYQAKASYQSKLQQSRRIMWLARKFYSEPQLYFPHYMDFRGRLYPIPPDLNPQSSDLGQGLLEFAEGRRVNTDSAMKWLRINVANLFGKDKLPLDERELWTILHWDDIELVATDPLGSGLGFWAADGVEHYQALAACYDLFKAMTELDWHSHLPVKLDGSNNGLQHLAALARDRDMAFATNCTNAERQDIYGLIASRILPRVQRLAEAGNEWAQAWLTFGVTRDIAKKSVMTLPYGATYFGQADQIMVGIEAQAEKLGVDPNDVLNGNALKAAHWLKPICWEEMITVLPAALTTMEWLQTAARSAAKVNLPMEWVTPDGFLARQDNRKTTTRTLRFSGPTGVYQLTVAGAGATLDSRKQAASMAPNFIHSLDACALRRYVVLAERAGIHSHSLIHDSFGTHALYVDQMAALLRDAFVWVYEAEPQESVELWLNGNGITNPPFTKSGTFDLDEVRLATYFFA
jgi:DNA-directed RNA polymerase